MTKSSDLIGQDACVIVTNKQYFF